MLARVVSARQDRVLYFGDRISDPVQIRPSPLNRPSELVENFS